VSLESRAGLVYLTSKANDKQMQETVEALDMSQKQKGKHQEQITRLQQVAALAAE